LIWGEHLTTVLTLRTSNLSNHASEVCFPGGRPEASDGTLEATALREAREELGIEDAEVLGQLSSIPLFTSEFRLNPCVAQISGDALVPHAGEVAAVIRVSLDQVFDRGEIEAIAWEMEDKKHLSPVFEVDGHVIFGATAHVLGELCRVLADASGRTLPELVPGKWGWDLERGRPRKLG